MGPQQGLSSLDSGRHLPGYRTPSPRVPSHAGKAGKAGGLNLPSAGGGPWDAPSTPPIPHASLALSLCSSLSTTAPPPSTARSGETEAQKERSPIKYDFRPLPQGCVVTVRSPG